MKHKSETVGKSPGTCGGQRHRLSFIVIFNS